MKYFYSVFRYLKYMDSIIFYFENPGMVSEDLLVLKLKELILLLNETKNAPLVKQIRPVFTHHLLF